MWNDSSMSHIRVTTHIWTLVTWMSHDEWVMTRSYVRRDSVMCNMTHSRGEIPSYVCYDSFLCVTCLVDMCDMTHSYVWHDSFTCVPWLLHMCDMTPAYSLPASFMWRDSFIYVTWLIHTRDMTHSCVWHDSFIFVTWLIYMCDMTHSYVWHDSFICVTWLMAAKIRVCSRIDKIIGLFCHRAL